VQPMYREHKSDQTFQAPPNLPRHL
jgi:hypothetical protein